MGAACAIHERAFAGAWDRGYLAGIAVANDNPEQRAKRRCELYTRDMDETEACVKQDADRVGFLAVPGVVEVPPADVPSK